MTVSLNEVDRGTGTNGLFFRKEIGALTLISTFT